MHKHPRPLSILTDPCKTESLPAGCPGNVLVGNNKPGNSTHIISLFLGFCCFVLFFLLQDQGFARLIIISLVYKISSICSLPEHLFTLSFPVTLEISLL